jgi:hypothetical protein
MKNILKKHKNYFFLLVCILFFGCMTGHKVMTMQQFSDIPVGITQEKLKSLAGKPITIQKLDDNECQFEYVERIIIGERVVEERHYYFLIKDKKVVEKHVQTQTTPLFQQRNAYDMERSQNDEV